MGEAEAVAGAVAGAGVGAVTVGEAAGLSGSKKGWRCNQLIHNWSSLCLRRRKDVYSE